MHISDILTKLARWSKLGVALGAALVMAACGDTERVTYDGPEFMLFSDTLTVCAVQNDTEEFDISVGSTSATDYNRRVAIEVVDSLSNAIEGKHYKVNEYSVVIPAGSCVGTFKMRGISSNIGVTDSLCVTLRLVCDDGKQNKLYGNTTRVMLQKACPLNMDDFTGNALVTSTFLYNYSTSMSRLIKVERDPKDAYTLVLKNFLYDDYDVKVKFTHDDILNPILHYDDQKMVLTSTAFGTKYGDGWLNIKEPSGYVSYYSSCEHFMMLYSTVYVPGMAEGTNVVGTFVHSIEMVSEGRAEELKEAGY